jgi:bacillithiol synthase
VQNRVLPAAFYVSGGGELAYHVQIRPLFAALETPLPVIVPRPAGTVLKKSMDKAMERIELSVEDLLGPGWEWSAIEEAAEARGSRQGEAFGRFDEAVAEAFDRLEREIHEAGVANTRELRREQKQLRKRMEGLRQRFRKLDPTIGEGPRRQYFRLRKFVLPGDGYQELSAWTVYFQALFGPDFLPQLRERIDPFAPHHHVFLAG